MDKTLPLPLCAHFQLAREEICRLEGCEEEGGAEEGGEEDGGRQVRRFTFRLLTPALSWAAAGLPVCAMRYCNCTANRSVRPQKPNEGASDCNASLL